MAIIEDQQLPLLKGGVPNQESTMLLRLSRAT